MYYKFDYDPKGFLNDDLLDDMEEESELWTLIKVLLLILALIMLSVFLGSCKSAKYVPVIEHKTDTVLITKHQRDSIFVHDSIHVKEKQRGDTVWLEVEKWHTRYIDRSTHDTTYIATHDTVPDPYPVPEYIEKKLTWWQQLRLWLGNILLAAILAAAGYGAFRLWRKTQTMGLMG